MSNTERWVSLDQAASFASGGTPSKANPDYWIGNIPWVSAKDMKTSRIFDTEDHLSEAGLANGSRLAPAGATLVLARGMTLLNDVPICMATRDVAFNQDVKALVARDGVVDAYLNYAIHAAKPTLLSAIDLAGHGTGKLPTDVFKSVRIRLPKESEQRAIAHVLGTLDDKIDLNRRMNETLEAMARAIFKSWFVDFDPVRAKASGEPPESICRRLGLMPDVLALFPDTFQDSVIGEIPAGWIPTPFGDWLSHTIGGDWGTDTPDDQHEVEVRIIRGTDMTKLKSGIENDVPCRFVQPNKFASRKLQPEDIVLEVSGGSRDQPTGRGLRVTPGIVALLGGDVVPASFCRLLRPTLPMAGPLLSLHLDSIYEAGKTWEYQNQSTGISNFQTKYFLERELVIAPSRQIIAAFYDSVSPMLSGRYSTETGPLSAVRDTLLPQLMSGELVVPSMGASQ